MEAALAIIVSGFIIWSCLTHVYGPANVRRWIAARCLESAARTDARQQAQAAALSKRLEAAR